MTVGWVSGVHGTAGQVRIRAYSDDPQRFSPGQTLYCNETALCIAAASVRVQNRIVLKFEGIDSPGDARPLVEQWLTVPRDAVADPPEGEYFHFQLLGLRVVTAEGEALGNIAEIIETGSNDVYVVDGPAGQLLIPAISAVVQEVRLDRGMVVVRLMDGMR